MSKHWKDFVGYGENEELKLTVNVRKPKYAQKMTVREKAGKKLWDMVRNKIHERNNHACSLCGYNEDPNYLHAHEVWKYDEKRYLLILEGVQTLCINCHDLQHIHHVALRIKDSEVLQNRMNAIWDHFMKVNKCSGEFAYQHFQEVKIKQVVSPRDRERFLEENRRMSELLNKKWRFVIKDTIPFKEEIEKMLKKKDLLV